MFLTFKTKFSSLLIWTLTIIYFIIVTLFLSDSSRNLHSHLKSQCAINFSVSITLRLTLVIAAQFPCNWTTFCKTQITLLIVWVFLPLRSDHLRDRCSSEHSFNETAKCEFSPNRESFLSVKTTERKLTNVCECHEEDFFRVFFPLLLLVCKQIIKKKLLLRSIWSESSCFLWHKVLMTTFSTPGTDDLET